MQRPDDVTHLTGSVATGQTITVANYAVVSPVTCPAGAPSRSSGAEASAKRPR